MPAHLPDESTYQLQKVQGPEVSMLWCRYPKHDVLPIYGKGASLDQLVCLQISNKDDVHSVSSQKER